MLPLQVYRQALPSGGQTLPISCITHCSSNIKVCTCRWSVFGLSISLSIHSFLFVNNSYIYLHSHGIRLQRSIRKLWQIFSNERPLVKWWKNWHWLFRLFRGISSLKHKYNKDWNTLFSFTLGNERTQVACKSLRSALRFTRFTRDQCPFISQYIRKKCTSILK